MPSLGQELEDRPMTNSMTDSSAEREPCGRRNCASWKRCCSPPPSRSTRRRSARGCRRRRRQGRRCARLQAEYAPRGVNLVRVGSKWTFRTARDLSWLLTKETMVTRKLSRAAIETLAIIAYHQPVTRAEIEEIRGVATSKGTLDVLLETGWIKPRGRRKAPGRPITYGTTRGLPVAFRPGGGRRSAGSRGAEGLRPARQAPAAGLLRCRCRPTTRRCATTRTRWSRAISTSALRRRRAPGAGEAPAEPPSHRAY